MSHEEQHGDDSGRMARLLELPPGAERESLLSTLPEAEQAAARRLLNVADLVWEDAHGAPALEDDPVAALLGLVPDAGYQLDPAALKRVRSGAGVKASVLADRLTRRGWSVSAVDVLGWETRGAAVVPPALVRAVADVLHTDADRLTAPARGAVKSGAGAEVVAADVANEVAGTVRFRGLAERFAALQNMTQKMAESALHARMLATVHRGDQPNAEQMLSAVEGLVDALESD
ncbi:hypothetical protein [Nocardioides pantholopis]|uniref:hypothetical protein n=1 Tax=Nocardioides pantholopis TaxID=2483798 RepID=UPI000F09749D|nr:hypothetical protein [Nocardioides pantholopis]